MAVVNIIKLSELGVKRIDAEFYQPEYREAHSLILRIKCIPLGRLAFITDGQHGYFKVDPQSEIRQITAQHIRDTIIYKNEADRLSLETHLKNLRSSLQERDVVLSTVGTVGNVAVVTEDVPPANIDQNVARIKILDEKIANPYYVALFLMSKYGQTIINKFISGQVQQRISLTTLKALEIPILNKDFQKQCEKNLKSIQQLVLNSRKLYSQAENMLLEELGLKDFKPKYELSYTASLSQAFSVQRVDAEYFQPAYDKIIEKIIEYPNGYIPLLECVENIKPDFDPAKYSDKLFSYVELADIDSSIGIIHSISEVKNDEAPSRARRMLRGNDVIVSSVEGSLEKVALVDAEHEGSLASTGFFQFRPTKILPQVLLVLSKSIVLQAQLKKECAGTILTAVPSESLKRIIIPTLPPETQQRIASLVKQSHEARKQAKKLLEGAKRKVEEAIENEINK